MSTEQRSHMHNQIDLDDAMLSQEKDLVLSWTRVVCFYVYRNVMLCFPYGPPTSQTCTGPWNEIDLLFNVAAYRTISNIIDGSGHSIFLIESKILCHSSSNLSGVSLYMRQRCILDGLRTDVGVSASVLNWISFEAFMTEWNVGMVRWFYLQNPANIRRLM